MNKVIRLAAAVALCMASRFANAQTNSATRTPNDIVNTLAHEVNGIIEETDPSKDVMPNSKFTQRELKTGINETYQCVCNSMPCRSCMNCTFFCKGNRDLTFSSTTVNPANEDKCSTTAFCISENATTSAESHEIYALPKNMFGDAGFVRSAPEAMDRDSGGKAAGDLGRYFYRYYDENEKAFSAGMPKICYTPNPGKTESYATPNDKDTASRKFTGGDYKREITTTGKVRNKYASDGLYSAVVSYRPKGAASYSGTNPADKTKNNIELKVVSWTPDPSGKDCMTPNFSAGYKAGMNGSRSTTNVLAASADNLSLAFNESAVEINKLPCGMMADTNSTSGLSSAYKYSDREYYCSSDAVKLSRNADNTPQTTKLTVELDMPEGKATSEVDYAQCFTCKSPPESAYCEDVVKLAVETTCGDPATKPCNTEAKITNLVKKLGINAGRVTNGLDDDLPKEVSCDYCLVKLETEIAKYIP